MPSMADRLEAALLLQLVRICASEAVRLFLDVPSRGAASEIVHQDVIKVFIAGHMPLVKRSIP
jgi:hypothetical protein